MKFKTPNIERKYGWREGGCSVLNKKIEINKISNLIRGDS